jgi:hypothetical protein
VERCRCQNTVDELVAERITLRDKLRELYKTVEKQERVIREQRVALAVLQKDKLQRG